MTVEDIINNFIFLIVNPIIGVTFLISMILLIIGIVKFMLNSEQSSGRAEGIRNIIWGIVGLFVISSVWAIVYILLNLTDSNAGILGEEITYLEIFKII